MELRYPLIDVDTIAAADSGQRLLAGIPEIGSALAYHQTIPPGGSRGPPPNKNNEAKMYPKHKTKYIIL